MTKKIVTIGSTFSGNKGAASMLEASIQTISAKDKNAEFSVFTIYPEEDKKLNTYKNVTIFSAKPLFLGAVINPLALLYKIIPPIRPLLRKQPHIKAIAEADVFLDEGGITFVNGREKFLIYNVATILPALLMRTRVIKCSQAMGPFSGLNKLVAKAILPRVDTICARGDITKKHLDTLKLNNVIDSTDYAFLMDISKTESIKAEKILQKYGIKGAKKTEKIIGVLPSEVVRKKTEANNQDYIKYNVDFVKHLLKEGYKVLLMAYSARGATDARHNNDLPVSRDIAEQLNHKNFIFVDEELTAQELRYIIGRLDIVVVSRFHAMIAALAMKTPSLVIGWSHKYAEIMDMFGLKNSALDSSNLDQKILQKEFKKHVNNLPKYKTAISDNLPAVIKNAYKQVDAICDK